MKKCGMALWLIGTFMCSTEAQYYYYNNTYYAGSLVVEAGCSAGAMNCLTDLGGRKGQGKGFIKDLNLRVTRPSFSFYITGMYKDAIGFRAESTFGSVCSYDSLLKKSDPDPIGRYGRNLGFKRRIADLQLDAEFHPLFFKQYDVNEAPYWSPYVVAGIGFYKLNRKYKINIPLGFGLKYEVSANMNVRIELIHRILFTDYLDDVSIIVGNPKNNDAYLSAQFKIGWIIRKRIH